MAAFPAPASGTGVARAEQLILRATVSAYLGRYRGETRLHTESDLRVFLRWCTDQGLDPLTAVRVDIERYVRWLQDVRTVRGDECLGLVRVGELQVHHVRHGALCRGEAAHVRLGEPDQPGVVQQPRGQIAVLRDSAVKATDGDDAGRPRIGRHGSGDSHADDLERLAAQGDRATDVHIERVGEGGFEHHAAVADPAAL